MYQALYRKYRPQTFDDVVGQRSVTQTLKNQILSGRMSHAYLFTGTRGTGKTSCAKILSKAVNCENPVDGNPCNCCAACRSIDAGSCMDVLEIDAASNNGVDHVRALRDDAVYSPAMVKKRVYIIDEVHMLSISAFNALLKIIEEPPEHLLFILATTELHKVPATILSRCQRFSFRRILPEEIADRLSYIAYREQIPLETEGAAYLARLADGGMRDAISLLDQCASAATEPIGTEQICNILGLAGSKQTAEMMTALGNRDCPTLLALFHGQYAEGKDLAAMLDELCTVARDLLLLHTVRRGEHLSSGICTEAELRKLLPLFSPGELLRIAGLLRDTVAGFHGSANRRIDGELCLIRLCEPEAELDGAALNARISRLENRLAAGPFPTTPMETAAPQEEADAPPWEEEESPPWEEAPPPVPPAAEEKPPCDSGFWPKLVERLRSCLRPPALGMFTSNGNGPVRGVLSGQELLLYPADELSRSVVCRANVLETITECASGIAGVPITVKLGQESSCDEANQGFERLITFGAEHPELLDLK